jgi:hypothetical protein
MAPRPAQPINPATVTTYQLAVGLARLHRVQIVLAAAARGARYAGVW